MAPAGVPQGAVGAFLFQIASNVAENMTIRPASHGDQESLGRLWIAFLEEQSALDERFSISEDALRRWHNDFPSWIDRDQRHILVAERDGTVLGFAAAVRHAPAPIFSYVPEAILEELYVQPEARRQGVGQALYEAMRGWASEWGAQRVRLNVLVGNGAGRAFWNGLGFTDFSLSMAADLEGALPAATPEKGRIGFGV